MRITCKFSLFIVLAFSFSARECDFKSIRLDKRGLHNRSINDCQLDEFKSSEGCRRCVNCTQLRLKTSLECALFNDERCLDECLYKNDVFDSITKQCVPTGIPEGLMSTESDTEDLNVETSTVHIVPTAEEEVQPKDRNEPGIADGIRKVIAPTVPVIIIVILIACIFWRSKTKFGKSFCKKISKNGEDVPMVTGSERLTRPLPALPPAIPTTERKTLEPTREEPSTTVTDSTYAEGVQYSRLPTNNMPEDSNVPSANGSLDSNDSIYISVD